MTQQAQDKITITFKHKLLAVAMMALMVSHAEAATLKSEALISGANLTVGDLFDEAGAHADYALAPAPAPGKSMILRVRDLTRVADTFGIDWQPQTGLEQVTVKSARESIDRAELLKALTTAAGDTQLELQLPDHLNNFAVPAGHAGEMAVETISIDDTRQSFTARVALPSADGSQRIETLTGRAFRVIDVPVLKSAMKGGDLIGAADIEFIRLRRDMVPADALLKAEQLVGMTPRRTAPAGKALQSMDLDAPMLVRKGQLVTMTLKNGPIALSLQGRAMQNGSEGDTVRILNTSSNQAVEGVVTGLQAVTVMPPAKALLN